MQHKPFRQMDNLISGCDNYIDAYAAFLLSDQIPPCLEDDMYRLLKLLQSNEDDTEVKYSLYCSTYYVILYSLFIF